MSGAGVRARPGPPLGSRPMKIDGTVGMDLGRAAASATEAEKAGYEIAIELTDDSLVRLFDAGGELVASGQGTSLTNFLWDDVPRP